MSKWNIKDLDKEKTEQSISNEQARLDYCRSQLEKLKKEYESKRYEFMVILSNYEDKINEIEKSIEEGENFILKCNEHLILDFDLK